MEEKLFGLSIDKDYFEVVKRDERYYYRYDAGAHQSVWREDEITAAEAERVASGRAASYEVLLALQRRLGVDAYKSNWEPPS